MEATERGMPQDQLPLPDYCKTLLGMLTMELQSDISSGKERTVRLHVVAPDAVKVFLVVDMESQREKAALVGQVREHAAQAAADMVVCESEGWRPPFNPTNDAEAAQLDALYEQYGGVAAMPGAIEVVMVYIETPTHAYMAHADVTGAGLARRHGELRYHAVAKTSEHYQAMDEATFSRLLPSAERYAAIKDCTQRAARIFQARGLDPHAKLGDHSPLEIMVRQMWAGPQNVVWSDRQLEINAIALDQIQRMTAGR